MLLGHLLHVFLHLIARHLPQSEVTHLLAYVGTRLVAGGVTSLERMIDITALMVGSSLQVPLDVVWVWGKGLTELTGWLAGVQDFLLGIMKKGGRLQLV